MKIGELRLIKAGTKVRSLSLQENIIFEKDMIVEITNTICTDNVHFFGKLKMILFETTIPGITDKANGEVGTININDTLPYKLPKPKIFDYTY